MAGWRQKSLQIDQILAIAPPLLDSLEKESGELVHHLNVVITQNDITASLPNLLQLDVPSIRRVR